MAMRSDAVGWSESRPANRDLRELNPPLFESAAFKEDTRPMPIGSRVNLADASWLTKESQQFRAMEEKNTCAAG